MRGTKPQLVVDNGSVKKAAPAPAWMGGEAKREWRRVMPLLVERRILTTADFGTLESYCVSIGAMRDAAKLLEAEGMVTAEGKRHPAFGIMNAAQTTARLAAAELGLTPVSRSRPAIRDDNDDDALVDF